MEVNSDSTWLAPFIWYLFKTDGVTNAGAASFAAELFDMDKDLAAFVILGETKALFILPFDDFALVSCTQTLPQ